MHRPPSTSSTAPVTKLASSDARYTIAFAMSSGVQRRPNGIVDTNAARFGESSKGSGFGLIGITERARILGCVPVIQSTAGGTGIYLRIMVKS